MNENSINQTEFNQTDINQDQTELNDQAQSVNTAKNESDEQNNKVKPNELKHRLISMLVLAVSSVIAASVLIALIVGQTLFRLFTKEPNESIKVLANQLNDYIYKAVKYLSFTSEERPFPYQVWDEDKEDTIISTKNVEPSS